MKSGIDKVTGLPGAIADTIANQLESWFGNPVKPKEVDKSRIQGIASSKWRE